VAILHGSGNQVSGLCYLTQISGEQSFFCGDAATYMGADQFQHEGQEKELAACLKAKKLGL